MQDPSPFSKTLLSLHRRRPKGVRPMNTLPAPKRPKPSPLVDGVDVLRPAGSVAINSVSRNGRSNPLSYTFLQMNLSGSREHLYVSNGATVLDNTVVQKDQCRSIVSTTTGKATLIELADDRGYLFVTNYSRAREFMDQLAAAGWPVLPQPRTHNEVLLARNAIDSRRFGSSSPSNTGAAASSWRPHRRASPRLARTASCSEDAEEIETPAKLEPPLEFRFEDGETMSIGSADIKTLYNNEWVNDNIIDFFINYEIENAVRQRKFQRSDIYNFNSFFFSRLIYRKSETASLTYYENIRRWLTKVDLFAHNFVLIPVNEHLHWYGCLIAGLPALLTAAAARQKSHSLETHDSLTDTLKVDSPAHVYIFDSLSSRHNNIKEPIFTFLLEHCKEKHNVELFEGDVRFVHARVSKQNNFNDCGIHLIYNIRKWLEERETCERAWRKFHNKFLKSSELTGMRKELIGILLKLHELHGKVSNRETEESDDDIELIEYKVVPRSSEIGVAEEIKDTIGSSPERKDSALGTKDDSSSTERKDSDTKIPKPDAKIYLEEQPSTPNSKQLSIVSDTKAESDLPESSTADTLNRPSEDVDLKLSPKPKPNQGLVNKQLADNKELVHSIKQVTVTALNQVVSSEMKLRDLEIKRILEFKTKVNDLDPERDELKISNETKKLKIKLDVFRASHDRGSDRPRDQDFVIRPTNSLDEGIQGLTLDSEDNKKWEEEKEFDFRHTEFKIRPKPSNNSSPIQPVSKARKVYERVVTAELDGAEEVRSLSLSPLKSHSPKVRPKLLASSLPSTPKERRNNIIVVEDEDKDVSEVASSPRSSKKAVVEVRHPRQPSKYREIFVYKKTVG